MGTVRNLVSEIENELALGNIIEAVEGKDYRKVTHIETYRRQKREAKVKDLKEDIHLIAATFIFGMGVFTMIVYALFF